MIYKRPGDFDRLIAAPPRSLLAAVIYGRDRSGVRERARALATALAVDLQDAFNAVQLGETDIERDPARLADELSALSLFGARRFVAVQISGERPGADRLIADALKQHVDHAFNPDAFLLVEAGSLGGSSPTRRAAEAAGDKVAIIPIYEDGELDAAKLVREALAKDQIRLTPDALALFAARLPKERGVARSEIERLALFIGPGARTTVDVDQLAPFLGVEAEGSLLDGAEHAFGARLGLALDHLRRAFGEGETGAAAVRVAGSHAQKLRRIALASRSGATLQAALKSAGVFWKNEREITRQVRAWSDDDLLHIQGRVLEADARCKTAGSPDIMLAERLYMTVAALARRAGL